MSHCDSLNGKKDKQHEGLVVNRINDNKALCHLYRGHKCILRSTRVAQAVIGRVHKDLTGHSKNSDRGAVGSHCRVRLKGCDEDESA